MTVLTAVQGFLAVYCLVEIVRNQRARRRYEEARRIMLWLALETMQLPHPMLRHWLRVVLTEVKMEASFLRRAV
jgi:hypothetical protein